MRALLLLSILLLLTAGCASPTGDVMARYGPFDIDGTFGVQSATNPGATDKSDIKTAGFSDDEGVLGLRGDVDFGSPHLMISLQRSGHGGRGTLTGSLDDGDGNAIPEGAEVDSHLDLGLYSGILTFDLIPGDTAEIGIGLGVTVVDFDAAISEVSTGTTIAEHVTTPVPLLAARGGIQLGAVGVDAILSGISMNMGGDSIAMIDLDANVNYRLLGEAQGLAGSLAIGYRFVDFDVEYQDRERVELDMGFSGPYLAAIFSF